ncbi:hypothetical protein MCEJIRE27_01147 [Candidatus Nanopelagicaceae bacterium]
MHTSKRLILSLVIGTLILGGLTSCSFFNKSVKAHIFIKNATTDANPISDKFSISDGAINAEEIIKLGKSYDKSKKGRDKKTEYIEDCMDIEAICETYKGIPLGKTDVSELFGTAEMKDLSLPVNSSGNAELTIIDGKSVGTWEFELPKDNKTDLYLHIYLRDDYVAVTQFEQGKITYTPVEISKQKPTMSEAFTTLYVDAKDKLLFQRPYEWIDLKSSYYAYLNMKSDADRETCKVFGKNCSGTSSYSNIASAYKKAYDNIITPFEYKIPLNSESKQVRKAELMLSGAYSKLSSCYWQTYTAANSRNSSSYQAVSTCWSEVDGLEHDLDIYLNDFDVKMSLALWVGIH